MELRVESVEKWLKETQPALFDRFQADLQLANGQLGSAEAHNDAIARATVFDVLAAHYVMGAIFTDDGEPVAQVGLKDHTVLESAIARQYAGFGGKLKWETQEACAATLFYGLVKNHPFHDGNKRTAVLALLMLMRRINRLPEVRDGNKGESLDLLAVCTANGQMADLGKRYRGKGHGRTKAPRLGPDETVSMIATFINRNWRKADLQERLITYRQLASVLRDHGYEMVNPKNNKINIVAVNQRKRRRKFLIWSTYVEEEHVLELTISFPGWSREVSKKDMRKLRQRLNLSWQSGGVDSTEFYEGVDSLVGVIGRYYEPLQKLATK